MFLSDDFDIIAKHLLTQAVEVTEELMAPQADLVWLEFKG